MTEQLDIKKITIGVVGLGLMGSSIVGALLLAGHKVIAVAPVNGEKEKASFDVKNLVVDLVRSGLATESVEYYLDALMISDDYLELDDCQIVLECVLEDVSVKRIVYKKIEAVIKKDAVIATNTSAIPIGVLQEYVHYPDRFIGVHWAEPAYATRFMEITYGESTSEDTANWVYELAHLWGKEPTLLKRDIKGFITNRLMYSIFREALTLVEEGHVTMEDIDKAMRYDFGSWITLMGIFRRLDLSGLKDFASIFMRIFPKLSNREDVPVMMQRLVEANGRGTQNSHGLYCYSRTEAKEWEDAFAAFNKDIFHLTARYSLKEEDLKKA